jgi:hypothetical protein
MQTNTATLPNWKILTAAGVLFVLSVGTAAYYFLPDPIDWFFFYKPAASAMFSGANPYDAVNEFYNAPWILLPLIPLALLPYRIGVAALFVCNLAAWLFIAWRSCKQPLVIAALLVSLPVTAALFFGQIDGLVLLGVFLPPQFGLMLLMAKPQVGGIVALFWAVEAWRNNKLREVARVFWPVSVLFLLSFALYGLWPLRLGLSDLLVTDQNTSLWPGSLMVGVPLLIYALRSNVLAFALIAAPFLSPYVAPQSWSPALVGLLLLPGFGAELVGAALASWGVFLYRLLNPSGN